MLQPTSASRASPFPAYPPRRLVSTIIIIYIALLGSRLFHSFVRGGSLMLEPTESDPAFLHTHLV